MAKGVYCSGCHRAKLWGKYCQSSNSLLSNSSAFAGGIGYSSMPVPQLDVAIVGGGPAGLACAYALTRAFKDIKVQVAVIHVRGMSEEVLCVRNKWLLRRKVLQVFERARSYKECGAGISLDINGLKSLQAIDPILCEDFQRSVCSIQPGRMTDGQGVFKTGPGRSQFIKFACVLFAMPCSAKDSSHLWLSPRQ